MLIEIIASVGSGADASAFNVFDLLSAVLIGAGVMFFFGASVGIVRFPDFYTRMHAAVKGDTLSTLLITTGMAVQVMAHFDLHHWTVALVALKIMAIGVFIMLTSPTSTHALMKAGFDDGIEPVTNPDRILMRNLGGPFLDGATTQSADEASGEAEASPGAVLPGKKKTAGKKATSKRAAKKATSKKNSTTKKAPCRPKD